jgi:glycopeptide antibiotics resistance protein
LRADGRRRWLALAWALVIVAVTVPWSSMTNHTHWGKVAWIPLATGIVRWTDVLGNVLLYLPLGTLLARRGAGSRFAALAPALGCACVLSVGLELSQVWSHARFPSATDVLFNVVGAGAGAYWRAGRRA